MYKNVFILCLVTLLAISNSTDAFAIVWSLENTPQKYRPALCAQLRDSVIADRDTQSYRTAVERKKKGDMWRIHKERLAFHANLVTSMRRLSCPNIP